jgi:hypothetical protein
MAYFTNPGWLHTALLTAIAALIPVLVVLVGLTFLRGVQLMQKVPLMLLVAGLLFSVGYAILGTLALREGSSPVGGAVYLALAAGWLVIGMLQYRERRRRPVERPPEG